MERDVSSNRTMRSRGTWFGEVLVEVGQKAVPLFVVLSGEIEVLLPSTAGDEVIVAHRSGQFTGEGNMITGRRALGRLRVSRDGEVTELEPRSSAERSSRPTRS